MGNVKTKYPGPMFCMKLFEVLKAPNSGTDTLLVHVIKKSLVLLPVAVFEPSPFEILDFNLSLYVSISEILPQTLRGSKETI